MSRHSTDAVDGRVGRGSGAVRRRLRAVRPSQVVGAAASLLVAGLVGRIAVGILATVLSLAAGGLLGAAVYTLASDRPPARAVGAVLVFPAGLLGAAALSVLGEAVGAGVATAATIYVTVVAVGTVGFAAALAGAAAPGGGAVERAALRTLEVVLVPFVLFVAVVAPGSAVANAFLAIVLGHLLASPPSLSVFLFPILLAATAWALSGALARLPVAELVDPARRDRVAAQFSLAEQYCLDVVAIGGFLLIMGLLLTIRARSPIPADVSRVPLGSAYVLVAATPVLRVPLLVTLVASLAVRIGDRLVRWAQQATVESVAERATPIVAGLLATAGLARLFVDAGAIARLARLADAAVGAGALLAGGSPFVAAVGVVTLAGWLAVSWLIGLVVVGRLALPERAASPALAAASCFALALVAVLVGRLLVGFLAAALAMLAWDAGSFGGTLRTELSGRSGRTEFVHLGGSAFVAVVAVGVAAVLTVVLGGVIASATVTSLLALGLAGLSAFLLLSSL